jgi:hypothetical protein
MPAVRLPEPFNHPDWYFEPKWDGVRAIAYQSGPRTSWLNIRNPTYSQAWNRQQIPQSRLEVLPPPSSVRAELALV